MAAPDQSNQQAAKWANTDTVNAGPKLTVRM